jgi:hypothetical protein
MDKPPKFSTSRQLRPVLLRLKRLTDTGLTSGNLDILTCLDLRLRRPTRQLEGVSMWLDSRIAKIAGTFDVILYTRDGLELLIFPKERIETTHNDAMQMLISIFGSADLQTSQSKKGW